MADYSRSLVLLGHQRHGNDAGNCDVRPEDEGTAQSNEPGLVSMQDTHIPAVVTTIKPEMLDYLVSDMRKFCNALARFIVEIETELKKNRDALPKGFSKDVDRFVEAWSNINDNNICEAIAAKTACKWPEWRQRFVKLLGIMDSSQCWIGQRVKFLHRELRRDIRAALKEAGKASVSMKKANIGATNSRVGPPNQTIVELLGEIRGLHNKLTQRKPQNQGGSTTCGF